MSQYEITRGCGHTETIQIWGTDAHGERGRRAAYEATRVCRACYLAQRDAAAASAATEAGWPELTGSDKQVAWASTIRADAGRSVSKFHATMDQGVASHPEQAADAARVLAALDAAFAGHTDARWWIGQGNGANAFLGIREEAADALEAR